MQLRADNKIRTLQILFAVASFVLLAKAAQIQLFDRSYMVRADATAIDKHIIYPARGLMYDRHGQLMVINEPMYDLMVTYNSINPKMDTAKFCQLLNIDKLTFIANLQKDWPSKRFNKSIPFVFLKNISAVTYAGFQEWMWEFPGFYPQLRITRGYRTNVAANVLGYIREVDQQQIESSDGLYKLGDYIGITGLEGVYERMLMGSKGIQYIMKDNMGRNVGPYKGGDNDSLAVAGMDLITSIDLSLQEYAEQMMKGKRGSVVAIEPSTGEILAAVSAPTYDPSLLALDQNRGKAFAKLLLDYNKPLYNRITQAKYPPGSIFKTVIALAGMDMDVLTPNRSISCQGGYYYRGGKIKCHPHPPANDVAHALAYSCNTYFITVLRDAVDKYGFIRPAKGLTELRGQLLNFGLGEKLGVDMLHETRGNIPSADYYNKQYGNFWRSTYMMSIGIGQGEIQMSTLQIANLAAMIANRGYFYTPHLVKGFNNKSVRIPKKFREKHDSGVKPKYMQYVVEGMDLAVALKWTGYRTPIPGITMCGKTGTVQNPPYEDHSVFMAFAPKDKPKIAIAVLIENAGFGAQSAAPIASLIAEKYLKGNIAEPSRLAMEAEMKKINLLGPPKMAKR